MMISSNFFSDHIELIRLWLISHPQWALVITFLVALTESLAIIGSIVPGSVTMTAIGMLAGSGVMRIDLTLLAATLGAIGGDSLSYLLGYYFRDHLTKTWPFSRYPTWLAYGKHYFTQHGGKSVLIGRFFGPLRSIIPLIAGMMNMNHWRFFIANSLSAIGWALLYVLPGTLIGAAGSELNSEQARGYFLIIIIGLTLLWLLAVFIKKLLKRHARKKNVSDLEHKLKSFSMSKYLKQFLFIFLILVVFCLIYCCYFHTCLCIYTP